MGVNHPADDSLDVRSNHGKRSHASQENESTTSRDHDADSSVTGSSLKQSMGGITTKGSSDDEDGGSRASSTTKLSKMAIMSIGSPLSDPPATEQEAGDHDDEGGSPSENMATIGVSNVSNSKMMMNNSIPTSNNPPSSILALNDLFSNPDNGVAQREQQDQPPAPPLVTSRRVDSEGSVLVVVQTPPASPDNPKRTVTIKLSSPSSSAKATAEEQILRSLSAMDMEEVSCLLREQDADLLERQESVLPNDATPLLTSRRGKKDTSAVASLPDLSSLPPAATSTAESTSSERNSGGQDAIKEAPFRKSEDAYKNKGLPETPNKKRTIRRRSSRLRRESSHSGVGSSSGGNNSSNNQQTNGSSSSQEEISSGTSVPGLKGEQSSSTIDKTAEQQIIQEPLSGQVYQQETTTTTPTAEETTDGAATVASSQTTSTKEQTPRESTDSLSVTARGEPETNGGSSSHDRKTSGIHRTESMDRRLCEAALFAEVVGDATVADELQILEEDQSDDDDDDDDDEMVPIIVENLPAMLIHAEGSSVAAVAAHGDELSIKHHSATAAAQDSNNVNFSFEVLDDASVATRKSNSDVVSITGAEQTFGPPAQSEAPVSPFPSGGGFISASTLLRGRGRFNKTSISTKRGFLHQLPTGQSSGQSDYVYKGLRANPPEIVKRGIQRGNYAQLHRKAWLEVSDKYHRYGKNLRFYYRHWEKNLGCPFNMFFDWLDSKGEAAGQPLPEIEECSRAVLDSDTVLYITDPEVTEQYALVFVPDENGRGRVVDPIDGNPICTGPDGWIFVLRDNSFYGAQKVTSVSAGHRSKQRFHHSSFFGGKAVAAAGIFITDEEGFLTRLYPHSGHYRPREAHMQRVLFFLHHEGVDLRTFEMDMQQILHVSRDEVAPSNNKKDKTKKQTEEKKEEKSEKGETEVANGASEGENQPNTENTTNGEDKKDETEEATAPPPAPPEKKPEKKKKVESLCLIPAVLAACFLAHKARFIDGDIFEQIHKIRRANARSVSEALDYIDDTD